MDGSCRPSHLTCPSRLLSPVHLRIILLSIDLKRTLLGQMRDGVAMSDELREALHPFGIQNMLASVGVEGSIEDVEARLKEWLVTR